MKPATYPAEQTYTEEEFYIIERRHMLDNVLIAGETVEYIAPVSFAIYWKGIAMAVAAVIAVFYGGALAFYLGLVAVVLLLTAYTTRRYLMLAVTSHRVILGGGLFAQEVIYLPYNKIEGVESMRTPFGMLCGYSNIILTGTGRMRVMIPYVIGGGAIADEISRRTMAGQPILASAVTA